MKQKKKRIGIIVIVIIVVLLLLGVAAFLILSYTDILTPHSRGSVAAGLPDDEYTAIVDAWDEASYKAYRTNYSPYSYLTNDPDDKGEADRNVAVTDDDLPASYDLRDDGYVTPVKDQSPWGTCWAFAETAAAETSILSASGQTYEETGLDLSELQLAWFSYGVAPEAAGGAAGEGIYYYNDDTMPNIRLELGGDISQAIALYSSGVGPANESDIPYRNAEGAIRAYVWDEGDADSDTDHKGTGLYRAGNDDDADDDDVNLLVVNLTEEELERLEAAGYDVDRQNYAATVGSIENLGDEDAEEPDADWSVDESLWGLSAYTLEEGRLLPEFHVLDRKGDYVRTDEESIKAVKRELLAGHGVAIAILADLSLPGQEADTTYYDTAHDALYVNSVEQVDHAVLIVGYDDNYSRENFGNGDASMQPPADGAWIIKNSWGAETEEFPNNGVYGAVNEDGTTTGYFYLSYYDQSYVNPTAFAFDLDAPDSDDTYIYQYTYCVPSSMPNVLTSASRSMQANVYTAAEDTTLYAVSAETTHVNTELTIDVYLLDADAGNPTDGTLAATVTNTYAYGGYHRMTLDEADYVTLPAGQRFSLVVTQYCPDNGLYYQSVDRTYNSNADHEAEVDDYTESVAEQYYNDAYTAYVERYEAQGMTEEEAHTQAEIDAAAYIDTEEIENEIIDLVKQYADPEQSLITMLFVGDGESYVYNEGEDGSGMWADWSIISDRLETMSTDVHEMYDNFAIKGYALTK